MPRPDPPHRPSKDFALFRFAVPPPFRGSTPRQKGRRLWPAPTPDSPRSSDIANFPESAAPPLHKTHPSPRRSCFVRHPPSRLRVRLLASLRSRGEAVSPPQAWFRALNITTIPQTKYLSALPVDCVEKRARNFMGIPDVKRRIAFSKITRATTRANFHALRCINRHFPRLFPLVHDKRKRLANCCLRAA